MNNETQSQILSTLQEIRDLLHPKQSEEKCNHGVDTICIKCALVPMSNPQEETVEIPEQLPTGKISGEEAIDILYSTVRQLIRWAHYQDKRNK